MKKALFALAAVGTVTMAMADGAELYKRCAVCHGEHAHKQSLNVSAVIAGWEPAKIIERLHEYKAGKRNAYGFGKMMSGQATKLTEAEMKEVAEYISKLEPKEFKPDPKKQITKGLPPEKEAYNKFLDEYFKKMQSQRKDGTFKEALRLWEIEKKKRGYK